MGFATATLAIFATDAFIPLIPVAGVATVAVAPLHA